MAQRSRAAPRPCRHFAAVPSLVLLRGPFVTSKGETGWPKRRDDGEFEIFFLSPYERNEIKCAESLKSLIVLTFKALDINFICTSNRFFWTNFNKQVTFTDCVCVCESTYVDIRNPYSPLLLLQRSSSPLPLHLLDL